MRVDKDKSKENEKLSKENSFFQGKRQIIRQKTPFTDSENYGGWHCSKAGEKNMSVNIDDNEVSVNRIRPQVNSVFAEFADGERINITETDDGHETLRYIYLARRQGLTDKEIVEDLGGVLEWVNGEPEPRPDSKITWAMGAEIVGDTVVLGHP